MSSVSRFLAVTLSLLTSILTIVPVWADESEQITVSAEVAPKASDYQLVLEGPSGSTFGQNSLIEYTIKYGSDLNSASDIKIEASWNGGSQEVIDYVFSSADSTEGGIAPSIDLVNQKIIWTIDNFPGQTQNKVVHFAIRTNSSYTGSSAVAFNVKASISTNDLITNDIVKTNTYLYNQNSSSGSSSSSSSGNSTTSQAITYILGPETPGPTTKKSAHPVLFKDILVRSISESDAKIFLQLQDKYFPSIQFGTSPNSLLSKVSSLQNGKLQEMTLTELQPETEYYFKVLAKDDSGKVIGSETFIFKTASISDKPDLEENTLIVSSGNNILSSPQNIDLNYSSQDLKTQLKDRNTVVVPKDTSYEIRFKLKRHEMIKDIKAILRLKNVLGVDSEDDTDPSDKTVDLEEIEPGVYVGRLKSPPESGNYEIIARITDYNGNVLEKKIADVKVLKKMTITGPEGEAIENARVFLYLYNSRLKIFEPISPLSTAIKNPGFTDSKGEVSLVLPNGKYKAEITDLNYHDKTVEFTIGAGDEDGFPDVKLEKAPFSLINKAKYYLSTLIYVFDNTKVYIKDLSESLRFFELNALVATSIFVFLSFLALSSKLHIPLRHLPEYFNHLSKIHGLQKTNAQKVKGRVFDENNGQGLGGADVYLIDTDKNKIVNHTKTNSSGDFQFLKLATGGYKLEIMRDSYEPIVFKESDIQSVGLGGYLLNIKKRNLGLTIREKTQIFGEKILGLSFEALLIITLIFELSLGYSLGWTKALVFIIFSALSLILWIIHLSHLRSEKGIF
jgi:hypothetical protein